MPNQSCGRWDKIAITAPRVNVQTATTGITCVNAQFFWLAEA
ncbi:hypothetical protein ECP030526013_3050 [Escherichia coli P0305260.13]|nr:hypothetical protein ECP030526013_3050 [Escherichia coli P0305260.13]